MAKIKVRDLDPKKNRRRIFGRGIFSALVAALITGGAVWAGSLTPLSNPAATGYTLEDIYNRLNTNAEATAGNHSFSPSGSPAGSMRTLAEIYNKIPAIDASKILAGTTYLGIAGTIAIKDSVTGNNGELAISLPDGYYSGKIATASDTDLIAANIKSGVNIFGIDGNGNVVDTSAGTAAAGDILSGKIAFAGGGQITGTIANCAVEGGNACYANSGYWTGTAGGNVTGGAGLLTFDIPNGYYSGKMATAADADLIAANIKSGINIFGVDGNGNVVNTSSGDAAAGDILSGKKAWVDGAEVTGTYSAAGYTWTKAAAGSWVGVNENLDWAKEIGPSGWASQTYSYCGATTCTNDGSLQGSASYDGPPGGWNGSNDYTNFNNSALQNYEVITANSTNLGDCTADAGDLAFPDGSVWDKSNAKPYSVKLAGCDSNDSNATTTWSGAGGSGSQYAYARNAPSALSIADAWDGRKNLLTGNNGTHSYDNDHKNDDYYDRPAVSWYADTGDGVGTSRLPMIEEYEQARQGTSSSTTSLLDGTNAWSYYEWSAEQDPYSTNSARYFYANYGSASYTSVINQINPLWIVVAAQ